MSTNNNSKFFRFGKTETNSNNVINIKKNEIILKVEVSNTEDTTPPVQTVKTTYSNNIATIITPLIRAILPKAATAKTPATSGSPAKPQTKTILTYSLQNPISNSIVKFDDKVQGALIISIVLEEGFYPISSIFWGKDYNSFTCENSRDNKFTISDSTKLPFVIEDGVMKINFPISLYARELGVTSLEQAIKLNCPNKNSFIFGKIVVLYTTDESEKLVATGGTKELFTHNNKYVGIC